MNNKYMDQRYRIDAGKQYITGKGSDWYTLEQCWNCEYPQKRQGIRTAALRIASIIGLMIARLTMPVK